MHTLLFVLLFVCLFCFCYYVKAVTPLTILFIGSPKKKALQRVLFNLETEKSYANAKALAAIVVDAWLIPSTVPNA